MIDDRGKRCATLIVSSRDDGKRGGDMLLI